MAADGFTIGEVLNQLKEEFEDITISKIRFLESEGLIYPDRTESGYRKFTGDDVDRLRFILTAQRDHYLPLKVIREQLDRLDAGEPTSAGPPPPGGVPADDEAPSAGGLAQALEAAAGDGLGLDRATDDVELGLRDLCEATGLTVEEIKELRNFGVLGHAADDGGGPFDADDVLAGKAARELLRLGLEPRHLRMYRQFVDREVALFEQLVTPLLRQRNPEARHQAGRQLETLAGLTGKLKRALLARALRDVAHLG